VTELPPPTAAQLRAAAAACVCGKAAGLTHIADVLDAHADRLDREQQDAIHRQDGFDFGDLDDTDYSPDGSWPGQEAML